MKYIACAVIIFAGAMLAGVGVLASAIRPFAGEDGIILGVCISCFGALAWLWEEIPVPRLSTQRRPHPVSGNGHSVVAR